jgi:hypothetical protein
MSPDGIECDVGFDCTARSKKRGFAFWESVPRHSLWRVARKPIARHRRRSTWPEENIGRRFTVPLLVRDFHRRIVIDS